MCETRKVLVVLLILVAAIATVAPGLARDAGSVGGSSLSVPNVGAGAPPRVVTPPDVYARVLFLQSELDLIRFEMGLPKTDSLAIEVAGVAPHEVYFQALTLFKKANRLSFEHLRESAAAPQPPAGEITPSDVMAVVESARVRIGQVKQHLGITESSVLPAPDPSHTPTEVFHAIMRANQLLNLLLDQHFSPADVYEQVTLAIGYTARLRAQFAGDRIPETPPLIRGKRPADVYRKLLDCFMIIQRIAERSGLPMLTLSAGEQSVANVTPSDVYDIATLLVSALDYLHTQLDDAVPPRPVYDPGRKLPSHVYQRARLLEQQLSELAAWVDTDSSWPTRKPSHEKQF